MIRLLGPDVMNEKYSKIWEGRGWNYAIDYSWLIKEIKKFGGTSMLDVGCSGSPLGPAIASYLDAEYLGVDRVLGQPDFLEADIPENKYDLIMWSSSLEHNKKEKMKALYSKSMRLLKKNGLFIATIAASKKTEWFFPAQQTNLSTSDICSMFGEVAVLGDYDKTLKEYRDNAELSKKYIDRFGYMGPDDPAYLVCGVMKVKIKGVNYDV